LLLFTLLSACGGSEAVTVTLPVSTPASTLPMATTDLGYDVTVWSLRVAVADLELTVEGETHQDARPGAIFHPGHSAGGEVTGELPGDHLLIFDGTAHPIGDASLLVGDYHGANWTWRRADGDDGLAADDPLLGHTFHLTGVAARDGVEHELDIAVDIEAATALIGAVFDDEITETSSGTLELEMLPTDPFEADTVFDGVDFAALPTTDEGVIEIRPGDEAHNILRRPIQTHDHYAIEEM